MSSGKKITILGAGLSGLYLGWKLQETGMDVTILEARNRVGGRIFTKRSVGETKVEMGATWLGPQHTHLSELLKTLEIPIFEQYMKGTTYFEPFSTSPPQPVELPPQSPSYRIKGGTSALISALEAKIQPHSIHLNEAVDKLAYIDGQVHIHSADGKRVADLVISTLPPALLINSIVFEPLLPQSIMDLASQTQTWMRDSIKAAVVYSKPFWRDRKLSGTLFSNVGPLNESYDHTSFEQDSFAMKGFVNEAYGSLPYEERKTRVLDQLKGAFGEEAESYSAYEEVVWSNEKYTRGADNADLFPHQNNGNPLYEQASLYAGHFYIAGSETSPLYGGYMEGAIVSAKKILERIG